VRELTFQVEQFLFHEAELLDDRRFEEWLALYEPDAWYWAPVLADATERGLSLAHFDEDRTGMEARIRRLRQTNAYSEHPPTRCCRSIGNVRVRDRHVDSVVVRSTLLAHEYRRGVAGETRRAFVARVEHLLRLRGDNFGIAWKRVDLVDAEGGFHVSSAPL
jgi:benzoate/toluate 1,2-dioxygenase beta subunit